MPREGAGQVAGQRVQLQPHLVVAEPLARQAGPAECVFALGAVEPQHSGPDEVVIVARRGIFCEGINLRLRQSGTSCRLLA